MATGLFYADFARDPFFNMAFDEWLFQRAHSELSTFFLRLYSWQPGGITFGVNQRQETALDFSKVGDTPVIRRITGGRALYHDPSELTYCIVVNRNGWANSGRFGSISSICAEWSKVLMTFLSGIGINSERVKPAITSGKEAQVLHTAPCFESNARHEIISDGRKIIASAQRQTNNVILQHGAIKINGIASHPALSSKKIGADQEQDIQLLTESGFYGMAQLFCNIFSDYYGVSFELACVGKSELKKVLNAADKLKESCLGRREITKQTRTEISL